MAPRRRRGAAAAPKSGLARRTRNQARTEGRTPVVLAKLRVRAREPATSNRPSPPPAAAPTTPALAEAHDLAPRTPTRPGAGSAAAGPRSRVDAPAEVLMPGKTQTTFGACVFGAACRTAGAGLQRTSHYCGWCRAPMHGQCSPLFAATQVVEALSGFFVCSVDCARQRIAELSDSRIIDEREKAAGLTKGVKLYFQQEAERLLTPTKETLHFKPWSAWAAGGGGLDTDDDDDDNDGDYDGDDDDDNNNNNNRNKAEKGEESGSAADGVGAVARRRKRPTWQSASGAVSIRKVPGLELYISEVCVEEEVGRAAHGAKGPTWGNVLARVQSRFLRVPLSIAKLKGAYKKLKTDRYSELKRKYVTPTGAGGMPDANVKLLRSIQALIDIEAEALNRTSEKKKEQTRKAEARRRAMLAAVRASRGLFPESREETGDEGDTADDRGSDPNPDCGVPEALAGQDGDGDAITLAPSTHKRPSGSTGAPRPKKRRATASDSRELLLKEMSSMRGVARGLYDRRDADADRSESVMSRVAAAVEATAVASSAGDGRVIDMLQTFASGANNGSSGSDARLATLEGAVTGLGSKVEGMASSIEQILSHLTKN